MCVHVSVCFCVSLCEYLPVSVSVCVSVRPCASVYLYVCFSVSLSPLIPSLSLSLSLALSLSIYLSFFPLSLSVLPWLEECRLATFLYVDGIPLARRRLRRLRGPLPHVHDASRRRRLRVIGDATPAGDAGYAS